jgi:CBS domain-containing protein
LRSQLVRRMNVSPRACSAAAGSKDFDTLLQKPRSDEIMVQDFAESLNDVVYISPTATIGDAIQKVTNEQVSCVIVCSKNEKVVSGICTVR